MKTNLLYISELCKALQAWEGPKDHPAKGRFWEKVNRAIDDLMWALFEFDTSDLMYWEIADWCDVKIKEIEDAEL